MHDIYLYIIIYNIIQKIIYQSLHPCIVCIYIGIHYKYVCMVCVYLFINDVYLFMHACYESLYTWQVAMYVYAWYVSISVSMICIYICMHYSN